MLKLKDNEIHELTEICRRHFVQNLYLFGSATNSLFDEEKSDIDLAVLFNGDIDLLDFADNFFGLLKALEKYFGRKVDLLSYRALKNPIIIQEIENSKIELYAA